MQSYASDFSMISQTLESDTQSHHVARNHIN